MENEVSSSVEMPKALEGVTGWIESAVITTTQSSVGQLLLKLIHWYLRLVEKVAQRDLQAQEINTGRVRTTQGVRRRSSRAR